jgi:hypothetical protein
MTPGHPERGVTPGVETCRDISDFFRLHAAANPPRRADGAARDLCFHPRQHCLGTGRAYPSTGGAARGPACGSRPQPGDANETAVAWRVALEARDHPVALVLTRQNVPTLDRTQFATADGLRHGAYVLADAPNGRPDAILIASGSEVGLIVAAQQKLQNVLARIVSMPSWELFDAQPQSYRDQVLLPSIHARLAVEAGVSQGWHRYVGDCGDVLGVERFGASAPGDVVMREYGFTVENVCKRVLALSPCRGNDAWMRCHHSEAHASRHGKRSNEAFRTSRYYNSGHCEAREFPPGPCATVEELVVRLRSGAISKEQFVAEMAPVLSENLIRSGLAS